MNKLKSAMADWLYKTFILNNNWTYIIKRIIYIFCFYGLCSLDQIAGSAIPYVFHGAKHYTGVFVAVIILTAYKIRDFLKLPYYLWIIGYLLFCLFSYEFWVETVENQIALTADLIGIGLFGIIIIRMIILYIKEKKMPVIRWRLFAVCSGMLLLMTIIRPDFDWPIPIFIMCLFFFLTNFRKKDLDNLLGGMLDGMILSFFVIQGQAWMHRPYDKIRYEGFYAQPSLNALFYLYAYLAALGRLYLSNLKKRNILLRIPYFLLAGLIICTMLFTGSRAAFLTAIALTMIYLLFLVISRKKRRIGVFSINLILLIVSIVVCMLPAYWLIRYIPVRVNEPTYFLADEWYGLEKKVQKNDPNDSPKYIEIGDAVGMMFERYLWFMDDEAVAKLERFIRDLPESLSMSITVEAAERVEMYPLYEESVEPELPEPGTDSSNPLVWTGENGDGFYDVRIDIYRYFMKKLRLVGEQDAVQGVWITESFYASHCHNVLLQMAYDFGIIIGIVFIIVLIMDYVYAIISLIRKRTVSNYFRIFVMIGYISLFLFFGLLEIDWMYGQFAFIIFFLLQYIVFYKEPKKLK